MSIDTQLPNVTLSKILTLDSTSFMSGNLLESRSIGPRFSLHTSVSGYGPVTTINSIQRTPSRQPRPLPIQQPEEESSTSEVGIVEWRSSAVGRAKTMVKMFGNTALSLGSLMKTQKMGSKRSFGGLGGPDIRWTETDGTWQCTPAKEKRILAVLHSRIATLGTRIEVSTAGDTQIDAIVLTALLVLHGEEDWKAFQNRRRTHSPYYMAQPRTLIVAPTPHVTALTLTLSTNSFLNGLLAVGGQLMFGMRTVGNRTSISKYTWEDRPRLEEFASIEWFDSTFFGTPKSMISYKGQRHSLEHILFQHFLGNRMRRFGLPEFLPWLQWVENPPSWSCYSHPGRMPLAILDRRFMTAGTRLDITYDGLEYLDALVISTILVVHSAHDWRRPNMGMRRHISSPNNTITANPNAPSASSPNLRMITEDGSPPGLPGPNDENRISRISGDSLIPQYSPPPVGLTLDYAEAGYEAHQNPLTPLVSAAPSMINLAQMAHERSFLGNATASASVIEVTDTGVGVAGPLPPSYHPPTYSELGHP
ncbi:hypothetical protein FRB93_013664 [Tulasnella sp. JGI-2019a]|nr:hypothetical protein FRB93_013664 [Tulasnella sp. JGI-2019a]